MASSAAGSHAAGSRSVVGISACTRQINTADFHAVANVYVEALLTVADCDVMLIPTSGSERPDDLGRRIGGLLDRLDGIVLTGGRSMIDPQFQASGERRVDMIYDPLRDRMTLGIVTRARERGMPLFGICRGMQEICCALGGDLDTNLASTPGLLPHAAPKTDHIPDRYLPAHAVHLSENGHFASLARRESLPLAFDVSSLHRQGIARLPPDIRVEARAADGLIEAVSVASCSGFFCGVQWHPEWHLERNPFSRLLFREFGEACRRFRQRVEQTDRARSGPGDLVAT